ncbi:MAG: glutathione S-transferase family protein [Steroidobacteraceae bacterium]
MKLVGMLDSPYVRRVAIGLDLLGVPFEHESVSVFSTFERFRDINPVVKAPTLICDDGGIVMDSSLILQFVEAAHCGGRSTLWSGEERLRQLQFRAVSYAQATTDKVVQLVYETQLRPPTAQHEPWKMRVRGQFQAGFAALEKLLADEPALRAGVPHHGSIAAAIAWQFTQSMISDVPAARHPRLAALSRDFEALPVFLRWPPDGPGVPTPAT